MFKWILQLSIVSPFIFTTIQAHADWYNGATGQPVAENAWLNSVKPGQVLVVSEIHDNELHHQNQRDMLVKLSGASFPLSVGMEFFEYPKQSLVDQFGREQLSEEDFLKQIGWSGGFSIFSQSFKLLGEHITKIFTLGSGNSFDFYRFQVRLPYYRGGRTYALNIPRAISGKVSKGGFESLNDEEKNLLPPNFTLGSSTYYERFSEVMKGHVPEEAIQRYFAAQSLWDETMAWRASLAMQENPDQLLMIIVGDFHVAYQDGLIARLKARGLQNVISVSQVDTREYKSDDRKKEIAPHERYGARADYIFDAYTPSR